MGGYDGHFHLAEIMENKLPSLNHAISSFWAEIKAQGLENGVVVVQGSEFGRTVTPNSNLVRLFLIPRFNVPLAIPHIVLFISFLIITLQGSDHGMYLHPT
jgi:hypothetical protein